MQPDSPADSLEFWVRFIFGALLGVFVGGTLLMDYRLPHAWMLMAGCVPVFGVVAGWFGNRLWHYLEDWL